MNDCPLCNWEESKSLCAFCAEELLEFIFNDEENTRNAEIID